MHVSMNKARLFVLPYKMTLLFGIGKLMPLWSGLYIFEHIFGVGIGIKSVIAMELN